MTAALILGRQLDELASLVMTADAGAYVARPLPDVSGSIGEHIRHCLDHIAALIRTGPSQPLSYDRRERGTSIESDPADALRHILRLKAALDRWDERTPADPVYVASLIAPGQSVSGWSTLGRELAFVVNHTIHHLAVIAVLMAVQGLNVPERLGFAPSTPRRAV